MKAKKYVVEYKKMLTSLFAAPSSKPESNSGALNSPSGFLARRDKNAAAAAASSSQQTFGVNLGVDGKPLRAQLGEIGRRVVETNQRYRTEIDKHKKVLAVNKQLSTAYVQTLYAIVDVSRLLNDYAAFFQLLTQELDKTDAQLGALQTSDVRHLEMLTRARMSEFQKRFAAESDAIRSLYLKQGMKGQADTIDAAKRALDSAVTETDNAYRDLSTTPAVVGGSAAGNQRRRLRK